MQFPNTGFDVCTPGCTYLLELSSHMDPDTHCTFSGIQKYEGANKPELVCLHSDLARNEAPLLLRTES